MSYVFLSHQPPATLLSTPHINNFIVSSVENLLYSDTSLFITISSKNKNHPPASFSIKVSEKHVINLFGCNVNKMYL